MTKDSKLTFATLVLLFSAFFSATAATTQPKVVFIGDYLTYYWIGAFAANPNWINQGSPGVAYFGENSTSSEVLAGFQSEVVSLHPAIVHILIGQGDSNHTDDASFQLAVPYFLSSLEAIVQEARASNIQVVLGMEPSVLASGQLESMNSVIASYGAANNIPVINYGMPCAVALAQGWFPVRLPVSEPTPSNSMEEAHIWARLLPVCHFRMTTVLSLPLLGMP